MTTFLQVHRQALPGPEGHALDVLGQVIQKVSFSPVPDLRLDNAKFSVAARQLGERLLNSSIDSDNTGTLVAINDLGREFTPTRCETVPLLTPEGGFDSHALNATFNKLARRTDLLQFLTLISSKEKLVGDFDIRFGTSNLASDKVTLCTIEHLAPFGRRRPISSDIIAAHPFSPDSLHLHTHENAIRVIKVQYPDIPVSAVNQILSKSAKVVAECTQVKRFGNITDKKLEVTLQSLAIQRGFAIKITSHRW